MTIPNTTHPTIWGDDQLADEAQKALEEFVDRRLAEPGGKYHAHVTARRGAIVRLFKALSGVDPNNPDPKAVRAVLLDEELFDALRYVAGPPVSADDLGVLVTRKIEGISKTGIKDSDALPVEVLKLICRLADPFRFPWFLLRKHSPSNSGGPIRTPFKFARSESNRTAMLRAFLPAAATLIVSPMAYFHSFTIIDPLASILPFHHSRQRMRIVIHDTVGDAVDGEKEAAAPERHRARLRRPPRL